MEPAINEFSACSYKAHTTLQQLQQNIFIYLTKSSSALETGCFLEKLFWKHVSIVRLKNFGFSHGSDTELACHCFVCSS